MKFYSAVAIGSHKDQPPIDDLVERVKPQLANALREQGCEGIDELHGPSWQQLDEYGLEWGWALVAYGNRPEAPA